MRCPKKFTKHASKNLKFKLDFRGLNSDKTLGLTSNKTACEEEGFDYPCYVPRGRWNNGVYISIEYSSGYEGFKSDYYVVIAASGEKNDQSLKEKLPFIKKIVPDAYLKNSKVYMGCVH